MKNSGFIFQLKEETNLRFTLQAKVDNLLINNNAIAICLLEIQNDFRFKFLVEENFR